jgi:hypothetical protein
VLAELARGRNWRDDIRVPSIRRRGDTPLGIAPIRRASRPPAATASPPRAFGLRDPDGHAERGKPRTIAQPVLESCVRDSLNFDPKYAAGQDASMRCSRCRSSRWSTCLPSGLVATSRRGTRRRQRLQDCATLGLAAGREDVSPTLRSTNAPEHDPRRTSASAAPGSHRRLRVFNPLRRVENGT